MLMKQLIYPIVAILAIFSGSTAARAQKAQSEEMAFLLKAIAAAKKSTGVPPQERNVFTSFLSDN